MAPGGAWLPLLLALGAAGCERAPPAPPPPAKADRPLREADLARVTLTPEAERRLDIVAHLGAVAQRTVRRTRTLGGELVPPPGQAAQLVAPVGGTVRAPASGPIPAPGARVTAGQALCTIAPFLSPVERLQLVAAQADAADQLDRARAQAEAAEAALRRTEGLLAAGSVGERVLEEARARRETAQAALRAAQMRQGGIAGASRGGQGAALAAAPVTAPLAGALREVRVTPGQQVVAGAVLFDVVDDDPVWVRVPVSAVELEDIDGAKEAHVGSLRAGDAGAGAPARPVRSAPATANPLAATVDLFYEAENPRGKLRPGQRVAVALPLQGTREALTLPAAAVIHDIHGGTWVYEQAAPQVYVRRRVLIDDTQGDVAILAGAAGAPAPRPGARIVTAGAMELFAVEVGGGK